MVGAKGYNMRTSSLPLAALLAACGGNSSQTVDAPGGDAQGTTDAPPGSNTITGSMNGAGFNTVGASYWIGNPDIPGNTVIYVFDQPVACSQMTAAGWDAALPTGYQILEIKMNGTTPANYPDQSLPTPPTGKSYSGYTVAMPTATDVGASGGSVSLTSLGLPNASGFAVGTFQLTWSAGSLDGKYDAPYCATGREP